VDQEKGNSASVFVDVEMLCERWVGDRGVGDNDSGGW
jgi:hypothetical protein